MRAFGSTGIRVSAIGLGAWQLGRSAQWTDGPDERDAVRIVHAALDAGVTFIDTAPGYSDGQSELNIGRALVGRADEVVICTKFGHRPDGSTDWSADAIEAAVESGARRMRHAVDVVLLHNPPPEVLSGTAHYEALDRLRQRGVIRAYGASVDVARDVDTVLRAEGAQALEVRLSALYQEPWEALARARDAGAGTIVKVPLESGWLSGKYTKDSVFTDVRQRWSRADIAVRAGLVDEFRALLPSGTDVVDGALGYLLAYDAVSTVIPGTRSVAQLTAGVQARPLPPETVTAIRDWYATRFTSPLEW